MRPKYEVVLRPEATWGQLDVRSVWEYRDLLTLLVRRDFVAKYKQTILGPLWFVVQPLVMTLVFTVIFGRVVGLSTDGLPPVLFYLSGQLAWNYFAQTLAAHGTTLVSNAALFGKVYFPRIVVPLAALASNLIAFGVQAASFTVLFVYYKYGRGVDTFGLNATVVFLPIVVLYAALLSLGVGLLLSAITTKYRDLTHALPLLVQVWMYATPVIYPLTQFPEQWRWVLALNPMTVVVEAFRLMLLGKGTIVPAHVISSVAMTAVLLVAGLALFGRVERRFNDIA